MSDHWAKEADRLLNDDTLKRALNDMRQDTLGDLVSADADNKTAILRLQAQVIVIDRLLATLHGMIIRGTPVSTEASPFA